MRTGLGRLGVDRVVAKLLLNHAVSDELAQIYDRGDYWKLRVEAATRWADHVLDLVEAPSTRLGRRTNSYVKPGAAALPRWSPRPMRWKVAENLGPWRPVSGHLGRANRHAILNRSDGARQSTGPKPAEGSHGRFLGLMVGIVLGYAALAPESALGQVQVEQAFRADLRGFNEVPSISSSGNGRFDAELIPGDGSIEYALRYSGLESVVTQAHIHFSQAATNGAIIVFLCTNLDDGPAGTQACPGDDGEISGVITADDVLGSEDQGLDPGAFDQLLQAMLDRATYANVHTEVHGAREIRGQITPNPPQVVGE